jgi:uncharacterized protein YpmS
LTFESLLCSIFQKGGDMKITIELKGKVLYLILTAILILLLSIPVLMYLAPQKAMAEWNSDNTSSSDSYALSQIEKHLDEMVTQLEKLNSNLSDVGDEIEKIRYKMD